MIKKIMIIVFAIVALGLSAYSVLAHGGNPNSDWYANPADKNCMGQLARMHAKDEKWETHGIPASIKMSNHPNFHGYGKNATVKQTMHAFQAYCK